jgi:hypothetical protein
MLEGYFFFGKFFVGILLVIAIPILISWGLYWLIKKYSRAKWLRFFSLLPILLLGYLVWIAFFPSDQFYKDDFREIVKQEFPSNAILKYKYASFPDHHGDYTSVFAISTDSQSYLHIQEQIRKIGFTEMRDVFYSPQREEAIDKNRILISSEFVNENNPSKYYSVAFSQDRKTILITRISW